MKTEKEVIEFEQVVERGCGMDVHKETVVATVAGVGIGQETRTFRTFTNSTRKRIRRGTFKSVTELVGAIKDFIRLNNQNPKPFKWTKKAEEILKKVNHCKGLIETAH